MATVRFVYFDFKGKGEMTRLLLAAAGVEYEDVRLEYKSQEWEKEKPNAPFGQLPYIVYNGKKYGQSVAIAQFFAREYGFYGKSNLDALRVDEVMGLREDLMSKIFSHLFVLTDEEFRADPSKVAQVDENLRKYFGLYEKLLQENGGNGYFVGECLTIADFNIYNVIDMIGGRLPDVIADYPLLQKLKENVESNPKIKAYLSRRKQTLM